MYNLKFFISLYSYSVEEADAGDEVCQPTKLPQDFGSAFLGRTITTNGQYNDGSIGEEVSSLRIKKQIINGSK